MLEAEKITDAELEVLRALWASREPMTLGQIKSALARSQGWNENTTKTLLRRLCQKGAAGQEKREVYYYRPLVNRDQLERCRTQRLIDKFYAGSARDLVASLVRHDQLQPQDVEELRVMFQTMWNGKEGE